MAEKEIKITNLAKCLDVWDHIDGEQRVYTILGISVMNGGDVSIRISKAIKGNRGVQSRMPIPTFLAMLEEFKKLYLSDDPKGKRISVETGYLKGTGADQTTVKGPSVYMGVDSKENCWMSLVDTNSDEAPVVIKIIPKSVNVMYDSDKNPIANLTMNRLYVNQWIKLVTEQINSAVANWSTEVELGSMGKSSGPGYNADFDTLDL